MWDDVVSIRIDSRANELLEQHVPDGYSKSRALSALLARWFEDSDTRRQNLTPKEARAVHRLKQSGVNGTLLAEAFEVSDSTVAAVETTYAHLFGGDGGSP